MRIIALYSNKTNGDFITITKTTNKLKEQLDLQDADIELIEEKHFDIHALDISDVVITRSAFCQDSIDLLQKGREEVKLINLDTLGNDETKRFTSLIKKLTPLLEKKEHPKNDFDLLHESMAFLYRHRFEVTTVTALVALCSASNTAQCLYDLTTAETAPNSCQKIMGAAKLVESFSLFWATRNTSVFHKPELASNLGIKP